MAVYYAQKPSFVSVVEGKEPIIVFVPDNYRSGFSYNWDDFGYKTTCSVYHIIGETKRYLGEVKLLLDGVKNTHKKIKDIFGRFGSIELPEVGIDYLTLPEGSEFYDKIENVYAKMGELRYDEYLISARDAGYMRVEKGSKLFKDQGYHDSLLREPGARRAERFMLENLGYTDRQDVQFDVSYRLASFSQKHKVEFDFTEGFYPSNINLIIGPNGVGKTRCLVETIEQLVVTSKGEHSGKHKRSSKLSPMFSNIICFSYSPYENIYREINQKRIRSSSVFKAFGFYDGDKFDNNKPAHDSAECLFDIIEEDLANTWFSTSSKYNDLIEILRIGINGLTDMGLKVEGKSGKQKRIPVSGEFEKVLNYKKADDKIVSLVFYNADGELQLSSGQHMFSNLVLGAISHIKEETLLLFDEPELFLHPSLEVVLVRMLRRLLERYNSYAVIATHSLVMSREVPERCTNVIKRNGDIPVVDKPPFETFGASMDRINGYVFDDVKGIKQYQEFLDQVHDDYGSVVKIREDENIQLNAESLLYLLSKE